MKNQIKCYACQNDNCSCVVFVNAKAELSSICRVCLSQAMKEALKEVGEAASSERKPGA